LQVSAVVRVNVVVKISKKTHMVIVLALFLIGSPFYKDLILNVHTYFFSKTVYEIELPADLTFMHPKGGRGAPSELYILTLTLKNPVQKYDKKYVFSMTNESIPELKSIYMSSETKKIVVDVGYKYNKYLPSNFDTFLIPIEIKLHDNNMVIFNNVQSNNLFWGYIKLKLVFYLISFVMIYWAIIDFIKKSSVK
jgi:hypothetical protein